MLLEQPTIVIRDKITTVHHLAIPTSPRILRHGDIAERRARLNYRVLTHSSSTCGDSRSHGWSLSSTQQLQPFWRRLLTHELWLAIDLVGK